MHGSPPEDDIPLVCPFCAQVIEHIAVTPTGELIGCDTCAFERGLNPIVLTHEEWFARDATRAALALFGMREPRVGKPAQTAFEHPRAHVWWVEAEGRRYFLKRYHAWLSPQMIAYEHSVLRYLAEYGQTVAVPVLAEAGEAVAPSGGALWGLYPALPGQALSPQDWMWRAPKAAESLALLHTALEQCAPAGIVHPEWDAWTLDRLDALLEQWPYVSEVGGGLVLAARDHLMHHYFSGPHAELPRAVVHGDFAPSNLLWRGDQLAGLLDFEQAHRDTALVDFAAGLGSRHPPLLRAVVATYTRVRPLSPQERQALPEALLLGAILGIYQQVVLRGDYDEAARREADLELLLRDIEVVRRAVAAPR